MFKTAGKTELNQISLTGLRALVFIGLLIVKPRSLEEIRKVFIELQIMEEFNSDDILRIDLNTIKSMGCEISRSSAKTNYKYVLTKHPFGLKIPKEELLTLKKVYNYIKQKADIQTLIDYHEMFCRIASYICDEETKEAILGISILKYFNSEEIKKLMIDCKNNTTIELYYKKNDNDIASRKRIIIQDIVHKNDKVYLYTFDLDKERPMVLNYRNVESIISRKNEKVNISTKSTIVKFVLMDSNINNLETNEKILEVYGNKLIIEGTYHNDFLAIQRMLSFGAKCVVLEPTEIKNRIIEKIKEMRTIYEC